MRVIEKSLRLAGKAVGTFQAGRRGLERPGLVEGVPTCGRGWATQPLMVPANPNCSVIP